MIPPPTSSPMPEDDLLALDPICPLCKRAHLVGEILDGHIMACARCDRDLIAVADEASGTMAMQGADGDEGSGTLAQTGHHRTRARWRRQGRR